MKSLLLVALIVAVMSSLGISQSFEDTSSPDDAVISVTGIATKQVPPDLLVIQFGVDTQDRSAQRALKQNSEIMNVVIRSITATGIPQDEISTSRFSIQPIYDYNDDRSRLLIGYRVTNAVTVETSKLDLAAEIIDNAVNSGANRVDAVYFTLSDETQKILKDDLLEDAVTDAKFKAQRALDPLDYKIIGVKSVSISDFGVPSPVFTEASFKASAAPTPIFADQQQVRTTANVVFLIGSK